MADQPTTTPARPVSEIHSRSRLAGYDPERLGAARVFVAGAGAVGQNLLLNLALAGIGNICVADMDRFEAHNATRSPLYPTRDERRAWGVEKATVVAHKLVPKMTAPNPTIRYAATMIQALGDAPIMWADVVFAAVDNLAARAYLAERCRLHAKPLIEVGFDGAAINLSVFGPAPEDVCWRCNHPGVAGAFSCTRYALAAEETGVIPAIQNAAAVLAGLQAECGIGWLHGQQPLRGKVVSGNIRDVSLRSLNLSRDPACPGVHHNAASAGELAITPDSPVHCLLDAIELAVGPSTIRLPDPLVLRIACTRCGQLTEPRCPTWHWLTDPRCDTCGGPYASFPSGRSPEGSEWLRTRPRDELADLTCATAGFPAGASVEVWPDQAGREAVLFRLPGSVDQLTSALGTGALEAADALTDSHGHKRSASVSPK